MAIQSLVTKQDKSLVPLDAPTAKVYWPRLGCNQFCPSLMQFMDEKTGEAFLMALRTNKSMPKTQPQAVAIRRKVAFAQLESACLGGEGLPLPDLRPDYPVLSRLSLTPSPYDHILVTLEELARNTQRVSYILLKEDWPREYMEHLDKWSRLTTLKVSEADPFLLKLVDPKFKTDMTKTVRYLKLFLSEYSASIESVNRFNGLLGLEIYMPCKIVPELEKQQMYGSFENLQISTVTYLVLHTINRVMSLPAFPNLTVLNLSYGYGSAPVTAEDLARLNHLEKLKIIAIGHENNPEPTVITDFIVNHPSCILVHLKNRRKGEFTPAYCEALEKALEDSGLKCKLLKLQTYRGIEIKIQVMA